MMTRRQFLQFSLTGGTLAMLFNREKQGFAAAGVKSTPDVMVYKGEYPGWPWIITVKDGDMVCVFREGAEHGYSASGRILLTRSQDQGKTWLPARVIIDQPEVDDRNVAISELPDASLLLCYNEYTVALESRVMTARSTDGGNTWTKPEPIGCDNTRTRAAVRPLADGTLLLPIYRAPGNGAIAALSKDQGVTWRTVDIPDTEGFVGDEWDLLEMAPGRLVGISRNNVRGSDGTFWQTESRDNGASWSIPRKTNVQSARHTAPSQLVWQNGAPTMIYPDRRMVSVSAVYSKDPALIEWELDDRLTCYQYNPDESPIPDGSYAVSAPIDRHTRLIVDYEIRDDAKQIAGYFVTFPETWGT
jgi:Neuraminidase (sialidase)